MFYVPVNSYGYVETVRNLTTLFPGQAWLSMYQHFVHIVSLVTDNNPS